MGHRWAHGHGSYLYLLTLILPGVYVQSGVIRAGKDSHELGTDLLEP